MALTDQQQQQLYDAVMFTRKEANGAFLFTRKSDGAQYLASGTGVKHLAPAEASTLRNLGVPVRYPNMDDGPCTALIQALGDQP